jgi:ribosomal protein S18 acetylase RimI-like enzyme
MDAAVGPAVEAPMFIVDAEPADGPGIVAVAARAGVFSAEEISSVREIWEECQDRGIDVSGYRFLVERHDTRILGFACVGPRDLTSGVFDLYWIAVDPDARGRGIGHRLLAASEALVREAGGRMLIAETSGSSALYEAARTLYGRCGYVREATIRDFYDVGDDLDVYVKRIHKHPAG